MKLFNPKHSKPGDLIYKLNIYYSDDGNISDYNIDEYLILSITNTNESNLYIIDTHKGNIIYNISKDIYYNSYDDAKTILKKAVTNNIKSIKSNCNKKINILKKLL